MIFVESQSLQLWGTHIRSLLSASALILSLVNGLFLLKIYLRDRPKLRVRLVEGGGYQWWFRMAGRTHDGEATRRYGFLAYVEVINTGMRKVQLDSWWLCFPTEGQGEHRQGPYSMPEPQIPMGGLIKFYQVLGQKGINSNGSTLTEPGCSITGMTFFEYECYGGQSWNPSIVDGKINATFWIQSILGKTSRCTIQFSEKSFDEVNEMAPGIHLISKGSGG